jgi:hypothetical protein
MKYKACQSIMQSDHKPIYAVMVASVKFVMKDIKKRVKQQIIEEINRIYRTAVGNIEYSSDSIVFEDVFYKASHMKKLTISNKGETVLFFKLVTDQVPWLEVINETGKIMPQENTDIIFTVQIDESTVSKANYVKDFLQTVVIINANKGITKNVPISVQFRPSCFGSRFEHLVKIIGPVADVQTTIKESADKSECALDLPKELFTLVELITTQNDDFTDLFELPFDPSEVNLLRTALDRLINIPKTVKMQSVWRVLAEMLELLPTPLVNEKLFDRVIEENSGVENGPLRKKMMERMNKTKGQCFIFLLDMGKEIYSKTRAIVDQLVEELMYTMMRMERNSKDEKMEAKRKLYFKIMLVNE